MDIEIADAEATLQDKVEVYVKKILDDDRFNDKIKKVIEDGDVPFEAISINYKPEEIVCPDDHGNGRGRNLPRGFKQVVINHDGELIAFCKGCNEYLSYKDFPGDRSRTYGISIYCKPCYNERKRKNAESTVAGDKTKNITKSLTSEEIENYIGEINKVWDTTSSITLKDMVKMPGLSDKYFIYMSKCDTPDDETLKKIRDRLQKPNLDQLVYIGQTNGNYPSYEGSGTAIDILKDEFGIDMKHDGVTKVIDVTESVQVNICEREWILNTGIIAVGLNISAGSNTLKKTLISFSLDPHSLEELEIYEKSIQIGEELGITEQQVWKRLCKYGYECLMDKQSKQMREFFRGKKQDETFIGE